MPSVRTKLKSVPSYWREEEQAVLDMLCHAYDPSGRPYSRSALLVRLTLDKAKEKGIDISAIRAKLERLKRGDNIPHGHRTRGGGRRKTA